MNCLPCFQKKESDNQKEEDLPVAQVKNSDELPPHANAGQVAPAETQNKTDGSATTVENGSIAADNFTFRELATATKNFRQECLLGEGGFGRVYKGTIQRIGQVVAVKQLHKTGKQESKEFVVEVKTLSLLHHPNLVNLVGYCADGDQRLLVYEYVPLGSLEDHLLDISADKKPLDWTTRMKIALGAAEGLEYLHDKANPPLIYRDLKSSSILLDEEYNPKLSDFGLAKLSMSMTNVTNRMMGTYGYTAPEYERASELTLKSDIYSFGVVLLELISGRRVVDTTRPTEEQNLVTWAQPIFRNPRRFPEMADPLLGKEFPVRSLNQVVGVAAMCLQEEPSVRPLISDVVAALSSLTVPQPEEADHSAYSASTPLPEVQTSTEYEKQKPEEDGDNSKDDQEEDSSDSSDSSDHGNGDNGSDTEKEQTDNHDQRGRSDSDDAAGSSDYLDHEDDDGFVYLDEDSADENEALAKKSKKWGSKSARKSKKESPDGSVGSISISSSSEAGSEGESFLGLSSRQNSNQQGAVSSRLSMNVEESWNDSADDSGSRHNKSGDGNADGLHSRRSSNVSSEDGSDGSSSGHSSHGRSHPESKT